jgi:hypothetical protein
VYSQASANHADIEFIAFQLNMLITPCFFNRCGQIAICNIRTM